MRLLSLLLATGVAASAVLANAPKPGTVRPDASGWNTVRVGGHEAVAGRLLVRLKEGVASPRADRATLDDVLPLREFGRGRGLTASEPLLRGVVDEVERAGGADRTLIIDLDPKLDLAAEAKLWSQRPEVELVEPDYIVHTCLVPNDTYFSGQWGLRNLGAGGYTPDCDIDAELAWDVTTGSADVVIAIIDTGVRLTHQDLSAKLVAGYDYVNNDNSPNDDNMHGTACASLAAASSNNSSGMAGVDWNARIMPLKALNSNGQGTTTAIINCINWARTNGADVISMSLGGGDYLSTFNTAINNAYNAGIAVVCATGNEDASTISYPARYTNSFAVGALSPCNTRKTPSSCDGEYWWGSNYGTGLDVMAPGVLLRSATNTSNTAYITDMNGTSGATPQVAGVAALLKGRNPSLTAQQIYDIIDATADDMGSAGWDNQTGHGRLNAHQAVLAANPDPCADDQQPPVITHTPLTDTLEHTLPYALAAQVEENCTLAGVTLRHQVDGGSWTEAAMVQQSGSWLGSIPASEPGTQVHYQIVASDASGNTDMAEHWFDILDPCASDEEGPAVTVTAAFADTVFTGQETEMLVEVADPCGTQAPEIFHHMGDGAWTAGGVEEIAPGRWVLFLPAMDVAGTVHWYYSVLDSSPNENETYSLGSYQVVEPPVLDAPGLALEQTAPDSLRLHWTAVSGAAGYRIWWAPGQAGPWALLADTNATEWTDTILDDQTRVYRVTAHD